MENRDGGRAADALDRAIEESAVVAGPIVLTPEAELLDEPDRIEASVAVRERARGLATAA